jgi:hypothetical protein
MPLYGRIIMAALALFVGWTMVRACRSGTVFSAGIAYSLDERPMMFTLAIVAHAGIVAYLLWLVAGYDSASFLHLVGLDWLAPTGPAR